MEKIDFVEVVTTLNGEAWDKDENHAHFSYQTDGYVDIIRFGEQWLWDSENDDRVYISRTTHEPFLPYIRRKFNEYADSLNQIRFENVPAKPEEYDPYSEEEKSA